MTWLVTGAAGFLGSHVCRRLATDGHAVVGLDCLDQSGDPQLAAARAASLQGLDGFRLEQVDVRDQDAVAAVLAAHRPTTVVHLAARAGVRRSHQEPLSYLDTNVVAFAGLLESCRRADVEHVVYASSSSVYGNSATPFSVDAPADHPVSVYAATKRMNELQAHTYSHVYGLPTTGLRLFTAYGPWGRPDMAYFAFADAILRGDPITVYGDGSALRDFTYVDDIVEGVVRLALRPPAPDPTWTPERGDLGASSAPWRLCNIGYGEQASVNRLIALLERLLGRPARRVSAPAQQGEVPATQADIGALERVIGTVPKVPLEVGMRSFVEWLLDYRRRR